MLLYKNNQHLGGRNTVFTLKVSIFLYQHLQNAVLVLVYHDSLPMQTSYCYH